MHTIPCLGVLQLCGHLLREGFIFKLQCSFNVEVDYKLVAVALDNPRLAATITVDKVLHRAEVKRRAVGYILPNRGEFDLAGKPEVDVCTSQSQLQLQASEMMKTLSVHVECAGSVGIARERNGQRGVRVLFVPMREEDGVETK